MFAYQKCKSATCVHAHVCSLGQRLVGLMKELNAITGRFSEELSKRCSSV